MSEYNKIKTSAEVYAVIYAKHAAELVVFADSHAGQVYLKERKELVTPDSPVCLSPQGQLLQQEKEVLLKHLSG